MIIDIDGKVISKRYPPFLIAEASLNHNGKIDLAYRMITVAKAAGVDAIKFQTYKADEFCNKESELYEIFKECELKDSDWESIKKMCDDLKITFLSTPQNYSDLEILLKLGMKAIKVGADDLNNFPLITQYAKTKLPIILSCGMAYGVEIEGAVNTILRIQKNYPIILLHCTSLYPAGARDVNMKKLSTIARSYPACIPGYSDHTVGSTAAIMAIALGAKVLETHFTLDNNMPGPDHKFSKNPDDLKQWVKAIREAHMMIGQADLKPTEREHDMRRRARRSLTALEDIEKDELFTEQNIGLRRPGIGLPPAFLNTYIGSKASREIHTGEQLQRDDIIHPNEKEGQKNGL
jgi:sialic acid synthase SpsE